MEVVLKWTEKVNEPNLHTKKVLELVELSYPASSINTPIFIFLIFSQF